MTQGTWVVNASSQRPWLSFSCRTLDKGTFTTRINVLGLMQRPERESNPVSSDLEWNMTKYAQCHETVEIDRCTFKTVYRDHYMVSLSFAILVQRAHVNPRAFNTWADIGPLELSWYNICNGICQVSQFHLYIQNIICSWLVKAKTSATEQPFLYTCMYAIFLCLWSVKKWILFSQPSIPSADPEGI